MKESLPAIIIAVVVMAGMLCLRQSTVERDRKHQIEIAKTDSLFQESERHLNKLKLDMQRLRIRMDSTNKRAKRLLQDMKDFNHEISK